MKVLALETANEHCSVALVDNETELFFKLDTQAKAQTKTILPMIANALEQENLTYNDLTAIAFSRGPGSFSGVRINAAVTQALAWANDLVVVPVSTLQAVAQAAFHTLGMDQVSVVMDARMQEVYLANFSLNNGVMQLDGNECLLNYSDAQTKASYTLVGSGCALLDQTLKHSKQEQITASAKEIATLAVYYIKQKQWVSADQALPVYLRDDAWKKISEQGKRD